MSGRNTVTLAPFTGGLNTEVSLLSDSYNTTVAEKNFYITQQGTRQKRLGIDFEPLFKFNSTALADDYKDFGYSCYEWKRPGTYPSSLYVIQCGRYLYFYSAQGRPFSGNQILTTIDLETYKFDNDYYKYPVTFTEGYGILYVSGEHIDTIQIGYGVKTSGESFDAHCRISLDPPVITGRYSLPRSGFNLATGTTKAINISLTNSVEIIVYYKGSQIVFNSGEWSASRIATLWNAVGSVQRDGITATASGKDIVFEAPLGSGATLNDNTIQIVVKPYGYYAYTYKNSSGIDKHRYCVAYLSSYKDTDQTIPPADTAAQYGSYLSRTATMSGGLNIDSEVNLWAVAVTPKVRDLSGVEDSLAVDERPSTLTNLHKYNLFNQGWEQNWIDSFHTSTSSYPSNNLQWSVGRYQKQASTSDTSMVWVFDPDRLLKYAFGNTPAAKGHYILDYYSKDRITASGISNIPATATIIKRPCQSVHYAGRLFMLCGQDLLYSQVLVEDASNVNKCYQDADPTAEEISDLVDTDGGIIALPSIGQGVGLALLEDYLLVFGDRGIVAISGDSGAGFKATAYNQKKISTEACLSASSIVATDAGVFFWSSSGIQQIALDQITALPVVKNVSRDSIKTFINNIPVECVKASKAVYNRAQGRISWWYPSGVISLRGLDRVLLLDIVKGIWYPWEISNDINSPSVVAPLSIAEAFTTTVSAKIFQESTPINAGDRSVIIADPYEDRSDLNNVLLVALDKYSKQFSFAEIYDKSFTDWLSSEGKATQYIATALSGYLVAQEVFRNKSCCYVLADFRRTELQDFFHSSCNCQARWQWNASYDSYLWDEVQELYRPFVAEKYSDKIVSTKTRIRGMGESLQLYLESPEGFDCRLEGLGLDLQGVA